MSANKTQYHVTVYVARISIILIHMPVVYFSQYLGTELMDSFAADSHVTPFKCPGILSLLQVFAC